MPPTTASPAARGSAATGAESLKRCRTASDERQQELGSLGASQPTGGDTRRCRWHRARAAPRPRPTRRSPPTARARGLLDDDRAARHLRPASSPRSRPSWRRSAASSARTRRRRRSSPASTEKPFEAAATTTTTTTSTSTTLDSTRPTSSERGRRAPAATRSAAAPSPPARSTRRRRSAPGARGRPGDRRRRPARLPRRGDRARADHRARLLDRRRLERRRGEPEDARSRPSAIRSRRTRAPCAARSTSSASTRPTPPTRPPTPASSTTSTGSTTTPGDASLKDLLAELDGLKGPEQLLDYLAKLEEAQLDYYVGRGAGARQRGPRDHRRRDRRLPGPAPVVLREQLGDDPAAALGAAIAAVERRRSRLEHGSTPARE